MFFYACSKAEPQQQHAGEQQHVPCTGVYAVEVVAAWEQVGLHENLESGV